MVVSPDEQHLLICSQDFPVHYSDEEYCHPDDYKPSPRIIPREFIFNHRQGKFNRLILRICFEGDSASTTFIPMSFILDTGAPRHLYLCQKAIASLSDANRLFVDEDMDMMWTPIYGRKVPIDNTPSSHDPANIMGLRFLMRLGLTLNDKKPPFFDLPRLSDIL